MSSTSISIAVIGGGGWIGQRHCSHVVANSRTTLCAIVDPGENAHEIAKKFHTKCYSSTRLLLQSPDKPDAAIICTPNSTHVAAGIELAQAGVHILCEKPIAPDSESAMSLIEAAEKNSVKLLVGHHRRFNPYVQALKAVIASGQLGRVVAVNCLWLTTKPAEYFAGPNSWRSEKSSGGPLLINAIHDLDLMHFLFGPVRHVHAEKTLSQRKMGADAVEEGAAVILKFDSGVVATFIVSDNVTSPHSFEQGTGENPALPKTGADVYRVFGSEGCISFPDMTLSTYNTTPSWTETMSSVKIPVPDADVPPFSTQLDHFVQVCLGQQEPLCSGRDGARALAVCEAIRKASNEGGSAAVAFND